MTTVRWRPHPQPPCIPLSGRGRCRGTSAPSCAGARPLSAPQARRGAGAGWWCPCGSWWAWTGGTELAEQCQSGSPFPQQAGCPKRQWTNLLPTEQWVRGENGFMSHFHSFNLSVHLQHRVLSRDMWLTTSPMRTRELWSTPPRTEEVVIGHPLCLCWGWEPGRLLQLLLGDPHPWLLPWDPRGVNGLLWLLTLVPPGSPDVANSCVSAFFGDPS